MEKRVGEEGRRAEEEGKELDNGHKHIVRQIRSPGPFRFIILLQHSTIDSIFPQKHQILIQEMRWLLLSQITGFIYLAQEQSMLEFKKETEITCPHSLGKIVISMTALGPASSKIIQSPFPPPQDNSLLYKPQSCVCDAEHLLHE